MLTKRDYSKWASPIIYVKKKKNKIRTSIDFSTRLNHCLETHNYPRLSPEDIFVKLNGGKVFLKLDLSKAYHQIPVDEERVKHLTINLIKGLYRFNRLPLKLKVVPGIFLQIMDTLLNDVNFAIA